MTLRLAFVIPTSPALTQATDTFAIALPGQNMAITGGSLIAALAQSGFNCCSLVTATGQVLIDKLMSALKDLVNRVLGPLISAGDSVRAVLACAKNRDAGGCVASVQKTSDLIHTMVNDGGGIDYAGVVTTAVTSIVKEVGQHFIPQLLNMIEQQIVHLVDVFRNSVCGKGCSSAGTKPPAKQVPVNSMQATSAALLLNTRLQTAQPPGVSLPANLHAPKPVDKQLLKGPTLPTWPKFAVLGGSLAVVLGAGWFFSRKAG